MAISFFNYSERFKDLPERLPTLIEAHCASGQFILKESVLSFENALSQFLQDKMTMHTNVYCSGVSSASMGMTIALKALGIGPGDEVITPAYSYVSTASAIVSVGATPVFVDVEPKTFMLCPEAVIEKVTARTKAVIAVHLYRRLMDVAALKSALPKHISILEDSATCLGGVIDGVPAGLTGDIGVYSFFPAKPLGGLGDAGIIVTKDKKLHRKCNMYRNHGQDGQVRFTHFLLGYNSRMDDINAAFLQYKLSHLDNHNARRREIAEFYDKVIDELGWIRQKSLMPTSVVTEVPYSYVFLCDKPKELIEFLQDHGIEAKQGFPLALTAQPAFLPWVENVDSFAHANKIAQQAVALPTYPELSDAALLEVREVLSAFVRRDND